MPASAEPSNTTGSGTALHCTDGLGEPDVIEVELTATSAVIAYAYAQRLADQGGARQRVETQGGGLETQIVSAPVRC